MLYIFFLFDLLSGRIVFRGRFYVFSDFDGLMIAQIKKWMDFAV